MDAITHLFTHFTFRTDLFFIGSLCRLGEFNEPNKGYLHFIRQGRVTLNQVGKAPLLIDNPCVIFSPTDKLHSIQPVDESAEVFCINFDFGDNVRNPLLDSLHHITPLYLEKFPTLQMIADQVFNEHLQQKTGHHAGIQYLCGYFMILVIRCYLEQNKLTEGLLKGLTDKYLSNLLLEIHQHPEYPWQLDNMAEKVAMSRSKFSSYFKKIMGVSAMNYVTTWRIMMAQNLLQKGLSVSLVAEKVGYSHNAVLTRIFIRELGYKPSEWNTKKII